MMDDPFDLRPDPELGHLLRQHFTGADSEGFAARLRAAVAAARPASPWDVLAGWAAPGLAAAALILLGLTLLLGRSLDDPTVLEQAFEPEAPAALVAVSYSSNPDVVLGAALEGP